MSDDEFDLESTLNEHNCEQQDLQINSSAMVKSHFFTLDLSKRKLRGIPTLLPRTERLIVTDNLMEQFPAVTSLQNLRYLDLSGNRIDCIPAGLNRLISLETLKLNNNLIGRVVAVQPLRVYQVMGNPVQLLELAVTQLNLEELGLDWLAYLNHSQHSLLQAKQLQEFRVGLTQLRESGSPHSNGIDINFQQFLEKFDCCSSKLLPKNIYNAIRYRHDEFFRLLAIRIDPKERPEQYEYENQLLFELALTHRYEAARNFFRKQRYERQSSIPYLHISVRHNDLEFFNLMIRKGYSLHTSNRNINSPLHELLANFDQLKSPALLLPLVKFSSNVNGKNQRRLNCLMHAASRSPNNFCSFLSFLARSKQMVSPFNFNEVCGVTFQENPLHLAARTADIRMTSLLIDLQVIDPFLRNSLNKRARVLTPHYLVRKLLSRYEKKFAPRHLGREDTSSDMNEEISITLPSIRSAESLMPTKLSSLQQELMKSHPLSSKLSKTIELLYSERQANVDSLMVRRLLNLLGNIPREEETLRQLILCYLQKIESPQLQQLIHDELLNSLPIKFGHDREHQSCLELYEQYQTVQAAGVLAAPPTKTSTKILPFTFSLCAEVDIASESTITIQPRSMRTYRNHREVRRKLDTTVEIHQEARQQLRTTRPARRLSLTFYR